TTCICDLSNPLRGDESQRDAAAGKMPQAAGSALPNQPTDGPAEAAAAQPAGPVSLTRKADEQALRNIEQEISRSVFSDVKRWRCGDPADFFGVVLEPMKDGAVRAFIAAHYRELWEKVLPERLKREHAEAEARLSARSVQATVAPDMQQDRLHVDDID